MLRPLRYSRRLRGLANLLCGGVASKFECGNEDVKKLFAAGGQPKSGDVIDAEVVDEGKQ